MKLFSYVTLGLLAHTEAAQKKTKPKKVKRCHQIKKGQNLISYISLGEPVKKKDKCKCIQGWKKAKVTEPGTGEKKMACNRPNMSILKRKSLSVTVGTKEEGEQMWAELQNTKPRCVFAKDDKWIKCKNTGLDSKKGLKQAIIPYTMEVIDMSDNHLNELGEFFSGVLNLKKISFANNFIKKIPTSAFKSSWWLEEIDMSENQLNELAHSGVFKRNPSLKVIKLNNNMIKVLKKKVVANLQFLRHLDLHNNRIDKLSGGLFSRAVDLSYLDFSYNKIKKIATRAFENNRMLTELYLNNNQITNINKQVFKNLENLEILDLSYNSIGQGIPDSKNDPDIHRESFRNLKGVKKLLLNNNEIRTISPLQFKGLKNLELINLDHNQIATLPKDAFDNSHSLKYVFARYNEIKTLDGSAFIDNPALKIAYLSHNELDEIPEDLLAGKKDLKRVDLGNNKLSAVGNIFEGSQENLYNAFMYGNNIDQVHDNVLANAPLLNSVDVSRNQLTENGLSFVPQVIDGSPELGWIDMSDNKFDDNMFDAKWSGITNFAKLKQAIIDAKAKARLANQDNSSSTL